MDNKGKWYFSTWFIVLSMICFWPVGVILLLFRIIGKQKSFKAITYTMLVTGIILLFFSIAIVLTSLGEDTFNDTLIGSIAVLFIPGILLTIFGFKRQKKMKVYEKYLDYISLKNTISITELCGKIGTTSDIVLKTLREMISKGLIDAYINESEYLVLKDSSVDYNYSGNNYYPSKEEIVVVKCKECGAKNKIAIGKPKECEYCGTILNATK